MLATEIPTNQWTGIAQPRRTRLKWKMPGRRQKENNAKICPIDASFDTISLMNKSRENPQTCFGNFLCYQPKNLRTHLLMVTPPYRDTRKRPNINFFMAKKINWIFFFISIHIPMTSQGEIDKPEARNCPWFCYICSIDESHNNRYYWTNKICLL